MDYWYEIKTRFKQIIRSISYSDFIQKLICIGISAYIKLVYYSSKKVFVNEFAFKDLIKKKQPVMVALWHNRIMMSPIFMSRRVKKLAGERKFFSLSSKHGDGKFVGKVMERFGLFNISGSSQSNKKSSIRSINIRDFREIFRALKSEIGIAITPDGPRGPSQKVGGEIVKIAKLAGVPILPFACGYSKFIRLKTWDSFVFPLPFGTVSYCFGDLIHINKNVSEEEILKINLLLEEKINLVTKNADKAVTKGIMS